MYLFINNPGSEFENDLKTLISKKQAIAIPLAVKKDIPKQNIINTINNALTSRNTKANSIKIIIFHPAIGAGMVDRTMIPLTVESIKQCLSVHLITISAGGDEVLIPAKDAGADVVFSIVEFLQIWRDCYGEEQLLVEKTKNLCYEKRIENLKVEILRSLLPLNIDMQALRILWKDNKKEDTVKYLKEMLGDVEDGYFLKKFYETKKLIEGMPSGDNKNKLESMLYIGDRENPYIYEFLKLLDNKKRECAVLTEQDALEVNSYFSNKEFKTFYDWYKNISSLDFQ